MKYNGSDYIPIIDDSRLDAQHIRIKNLMEHGGWKTLNEISALTGDPEASISAQLRHLRKERFGSWVIEKRPRKSRKSGLFEYRMMPKGHESSFVIKSRINKHKEVLRKIYKEFPQTRNKIMEYLNE